MKTILGALALVSCTIAANVPFQPKAGFPVQPSAAGSSSSQSATNEVLQSVNDRIMERLRQEVGSERGVYHVYLPDGRLQRVQYTTAPLASQQQVTTGGYSANQESVQANLGLDRVMTYYAELSPEQLGGIRAAQAARRYELQRQAVGNFGTSEKNYQPLETNGEFVPLTVVTTEQLAQYSSRQ